MGAGASSVGGDPPAILSPPEALACKEAGNAAFAEDRFLEAEEAYTEAIALANAYSMSASGEPASPSALAALWSNRSAARQKLNKSGAALSDALIAVTMRPRWGKGYWRAGVAAMALEQYHLAREYLRRALALTPESSHHRISVELEKATARRPVGIKDGPGSLVTWGLLPSEGCGASGGQVMQASPRVVAGLRGQHMVDISCGAMHTVAVTSTGTYAWGNNSHGQCGIGITASTAAGRGGGSGGGGGPAHNISVPQLVPSLIGVKVKAVSCGSGHSCAIDEGGVLWSWGISGQGQLGLGGDYASRSVPTPTAVLKLYADGRRAVGVSCGIAHTAVLAVTHDKIKGWDTSMSCLFAFGWNRSGQLGLGMDHATVECVHDPTHVPPSSFGDSGIVQQVACGGAHTLVVTQSGTLFATGSGSCGQLGLGAGTANSMLADKDDDDASSSMSGPTSDALAVLAAGKKMMNEHPDCFAYREVHVGDAGQTVAFACAGEEFSCIVTRDTQDVFAFGLNNAGQCGDGRTKNCIVPTRVEAMSGKMVQSLVSGKAVTRAMTEGGEVWGWGGWEDTQKGRGILDQPPSDAHSDAPRTPQRFSKLKKRVRQLEIGRSHYAALLYSTSPEQSYIDHDVKKPRRRGCGSNTKLGARFVVQVGKKYSFALQAMDDGGMEVHAGCEQFHVRSRHAASGAISFAESVFDDNFDGTYAVSVAPARTGIFVVEVQLHGVHVSGSPFEIAAVPSAEEELTSMMVEDRAVMGHAPTAGAEEKEKAREKEEEMTKRRLIMARLRREETTRRRAKEALAKEQRRRQREQAAERRRKKQKRCGGGFVVNYQNLSFDGDDAEAIQKGRQSGNAGAAAKSAW
jgi:alpha-tubulin suppressor-like RCC1 family protein